MKDNCIAIIQKQVSMKIIIWWRESHKTSMRTWNDSPGMILASPYCKQGLQTCVKFCSLVLIFRCLSELAELVLLSYSSGRFTHYFDRLHDFSVTVPWCYEDVNVNSFFPCTARPWNFLPAECFPLSYHLNSLSLESITPFTFRFFLNSFSCLLLIFYFPFPM